MKFLLETTLAILIFVGLIYLIFSFGNGGFNFQTWEKASQEALALASMFMSMFILVIQIFRYL